MLELKEYLDGLTNSSSARVSTVDSKWTLILLILFAVLVPLLLRSYYLMVRKHDLNDKLWRVICSVFTVVTICTVLYTVETITVNVNLIKERDTKITKYLSDNYNSISTYHVTSSDTLISIDSPEFKGADTLVLGERAKAYVRNRSIREVSYLIIDGSFVETRTTSKNTRIPMVVSGKTNIVEVGEMVFNEDVLELINKEFDTKYTSQEMFDKLGIINREIKFFIAE